jgi:hypothetical protein
MSFLPNISPGNVRQRLPSSFVYDNDLTWDRPTEWLDLGIISAYGTDTVPEKIKGVVAVYPNDVAPAHNYVAFHLDTNDDSSYTVNWGDGTTETLTENTTHYHVYDYDAITSDTSTTKATEFRGYKQVIFEVTLTGSAKFSEIDFDVDGPFTTHTNYLYRKGQPILDLFVSTSNATNITISDNRPLVICEQIELRNTSSNRLTGPANIYNGAKCLQSIPFVPWVYNAGARSYYYVFAQCNALKFLPDDFASDDKYWFKNSNKFQQAFDGCYSLQYVPEGLFGSSEQASCSNFYLMFRDCRSLRYIPYLGIRTGSGTDTRLDYVFNNCYNLQKIPEGFSIQRADTNDIDRLFYGCRTVIDWSSIFDGVTDVIGNMNLSSGIHIEQTFSTWTNIEEFPFVGQFTKCNNAENGWNGNYKMKRFSSQYTHLDFSNITMLETCFNACYNLEELPEIRVRSLTTANALYRTFYRCQKLRKIKFTGMIAGSSNGEYNGLFYGNYSLTTIDGMDFSFATETSDYYQMFHICRDINAIKFPGTFRAGYASPRINVTVNGDSAMSGEYQIEAQIAGGLDYYQVGGDGLLQRSGDATNGYKWTFVNTDQGTTPHESSTETNTANTPHLATWPSNTLTFSEVMTGFKYTVSGNSGDGLRYSPIKRTQLLEIFNQLQTVGYTATLDIRNNTYTADLTDEDKAIATDKGWTLSLSY